MAGMVNAAARGWTSALSRPELAERRGDELGDHLRGGPVLPGGLVGVDLLRDALVGVAEPVGNDLAVDPQIAGQGGMCRAMIVALIFRRCSQTSS